MRLLRSHPTLPPPQFDVGNLAIATGGHNNGRVGTIVHKEKHKGSFDIVHIKARGGVQLRLETLPDGCQRSSSP